MDQVEVRILDVGYAANRLCLYNIFYHTYKCGSSIGKRKHDTGKAALGLGLALSICLHLAIPRASSNACLDEIAFREHLTTQPLPYVFFEDHLTSEISLVHGTSPMTKIAEAKSGVSVLIDELNSCPRRTL